MQKPQGYDEAKPENFEGFANGPKAGACVLGIVNTVAGETKTGKEKITLYLDIAEGEFRNYYGDLSKKLQKSCYIKYDQLTEGEKSIAYFKGMIKAIEESNSGYKFNFDENTLKRKLVGAMLQEKRYYNGSGESKSILKVGFLCSVTKAKSGELKMLPPEEPEEPSNAGMFDMPSPPSEDNSPLPF